MDFLSWTVFFFKYHKQFQAIFLDFQKVAVYGNSWKY